VRAENRQLLKVNVSEAEKLGALIRNERFKNSFVLLIMNREVL
jgi:hypothetical protein